MVCIVRGLYVVTLFTCIRVLHVFEFCMPLLVLLFIAVYWKLAGIGLLPERRYR